MNTYKHLNLRHATKYTRFLLGLANGSDKREGVSIHPRVLFGRTMGKKVNTAKAPKEK